MFLLYELFDHFQCLKCTDERRCAQMSSETEARQQWEATDWRGNSHTQTCFSSDRPQRAEDSLRCEWDTHTNKPNTSYTSTACLLSVEYLFSLSLSLSVSCWIDIWPSYWSWLHCSIYHNSNENMYRNLSFPKKHGAYHSEVTVTTLRCFYGVAMVFWVVAKALLRCSGLLDAQALFDKATLN